MNSKDVKVIFKSLDVVSSEIDEDEDIKTIKVKISNKDAQSIGRKLEKIDKTEESYGGFY